MKKSEHSTLHEKTMWDFLYKSCRKRIAADGEQIELDCEYNVVLRALADSTRKWCDAHSEHGFDIEYKLNGAKNFLDDVQQALSYKLDILEGKAEKLLTDAEREEKLSLRGKLWRNVDVRRSLYGAFVWEGWEKRCIEINKTRLKSRIAYYLSSPWLDSVYLERLFLIALVSHEIVAVGDSIKQQLVNHRGKKVARELLKYEGEGAGYVDDNLGTLEEDRLTTVTSFELSQSLQRMLTMVSAKFLSLKRRGVDEIFHEANIYQAIFSMWIALQGSVINFSNIRRKLDEASHRGVLWDNAVYALVDILSQRNAHFLVIADSED